MHRIIVLSSFRGLQDRAILIIGAGLPCNWCLKLRQAGKLPGFGCLPNPWKSMKIYRNQWKSMKINENPGLGRSRHPNLVIPSPNVEFWRPPTSIFSIRARRQRRQPVNIICLFRRRWNILRSSPRKDWRVGISFLLSARPPPAARRPAASPSYIIRPISKNVQAICNCLIQTCR